MCAKLPNTAPTLPKTISIVGPVNLSIMVSAWSAWAWVSLPAVTCWSMTLACWSRICCTMAGCEKITTEEITPTTIKINAGASQLDVVGLEFLTSSKTSPGAAKTFNSRDQTVV